MRLILMGAVLAAALAATAVPALELDDPTLGPGDTFTTDLTADADGVDTESEPISDGRPPGGPAPEPFASVSWSVLGENEDGGACVRTVTRIAWNSGEFYGFIEIRNQAEEEFRRQLQLLAQGAPLEECPGVTVDLALEEAVATIAGTLDAPGIDLAPDSTAITGLRTFLATGVEMVQSYPERVSVQGVGFDVQVDLSATHVVDWGDGTVQTDIVVPGERYDPSDPDPGPEDITHVYVDRGQPTLSITTTWQVTVSAAGQTRTADITLDPVTEPITVLEVRSVRDR